MAPSTRAHLGVNGHRRGRGSAEVDAANAAELRANAQDVIFAINESMPKNTSRNYEPKQREFQVREAKARSVHIVRILRVELGVLCGEALPRRRYGHGGEAPPIYRGARR